MFIFFDKNDAQVKTSLGDQNAAHDLKKLAHNMIKRLLLLTIFSFTLTSLAFGQLFEDFEEGSTPGYTTGQVTLPTGNWNFNDALIGSDARDFKNGNQSVRVRNGGIGMGFDFSNGVSEFSFYASNSGFANDVGGVLELYLSTDSGSTWNIVEDDIELTDTLEQYTYQVNENGSVRFRIDKIAGGRINIDDVLLEPFVEISENPSISIRRGNDTVEEGSELSFPIISVGASRTIDLQVRNNGEPDLEISNVTFQNGTAFSAEINTDQAIETGQNQLLSVTFSPPSPELFNDVLTISSNDPDQPEFTLTFRGEALSTDDIIPISEARNLPIGTVVTVTGWLTVTDEFSGPVYFQDESGGIAWYNGSLMRNNGFNLEVARGDSLVLTGELGEFNELLQIVGSQDAIQYEIYPEGNREVLPLDISVAQLNSGEYEGRLIRINNFEIDHSGAFQGGQNYTITDQTGEGQFRVDQQTNVPGSQVPQQPLDAVGVAGHFNGTNQIIPRDTDDLNIEPFTYPGEDIPKNQTFDVVTWNIEWFGHSGNGPDDLDLQMNNVIEVIRTIDADLYALQEIANEQRFFALVDSLEGYDGFWADYITQNQKMAYIYKTDVIQKINSGPHMTNQDPFDWAFRLPLWFEFDATVNDVTRRIRSYNTHAKAISDEDSYNRRVMASLRMKEYLDSFRTDDNVIFIGDYNDRLITATFDDQESPYSNFVDDGNYYTITYDLEERGFASYIAGRFRSMIDHITVTNDLIEDHIDGAQRVENPNYIGSFISTTSDHAPVWTRFDFSRSLVSTEDDYISESPEMFELKQNYPNPFNPTTNISFNVPERADVSLKVYDVMGREVASIANNQSFSRGAHTLAFDASSLSSGMYIYRLTLNNGMSLSRKMMIVK